MRRVLPSILIVVALMISSTSFAESAGEMSSKCRAIADSKMFEDKISYVQDHDTGVCWGAFIVIQTLLVWGDDPNSKNTMFKICAPSESRRSQLIQIFIKYTQDHPERLHEDFVAVALDSLRETWPCAPASSILPGKRSPKKK